jgi:hypothetical protein
LKNKFTINNTAGIAVMLLLIGGIGATSILFSIALAQSATLGEPFIVQKGAETIQREIGSNRTQYTFTADGTINGNIEVTDTGQYISISKDNNQTFDQGHGVLRTKDGSEMANYTFIEVGNGTGFQGASVYNTNSTGKLSFLDNSVVIFKLGLDESGKYVGKQWLWK